MSADHARQIRADEPHRGKHIDVEVGAPLRIGDLAGRNRTEDPEIVDQHVDVGQLVQQLGDAGLGGDVGGDADHLGFFLL